MAQLGPHLSLPKAKARLCQGCSLSEGPGEESSLKHIQDPISSQAVSWGQSLFLEAAPNLFKASYVASLQQWQVVSSQSSSLFSFPICSVGQVDSSTFLDCLCDYFVQTLRAQDNFSISSL